MTVAVLVRMHSISCRYVLIRASFDTPSASSFANLPVSSIIVASTLVALSCIAEQRVWSSLLASVSEVMWKSLAVASTRAIESSCRCCERASVAAARLRRNSTIARSWVESLTCTEASAVFLSAFSCFSGPGEPQLCQWLNGELPVQVLLDFGVSHDRAVAKWIDSNNTSSIRAGELIRTGHHDKELDQPNGG